MNNENKAKSDKDAFYAGWRYAINVLIQDGKYDPETNKKIMEKYYQGWENGQVKYIRMIMKPNKKHPIVIEFGRDIKSMRQRAALAQLLPRLGEWEEIGKWRVWHYYISKFELPYDFQIVKDFEKYAEEVLIPAGWEWDRKRDFDHVWDERSAAIEYEFSKELQNYTRIEFNVRFSSTMDGATCVINTLVKPESKDGVFEIICEDGAMEIGNG